jgi:hypothetical protein
VLMQVCGGLSGVLRVSGLARLAGLVGGGVSGPSGLARVERIGWLRIAVGSTREGVLAHADGVGGRDAHRLDHAGRSPPALAAPIPDDHPAGDGRTGIRHPMHELQLPLPRAHRPSIRGVTSPFPPAERHPCRRGRRSSSARASSFHKTASPHEAHHEEGLRLGGSVGEETSSSRQIGSTPSVRDARR